MVVEEILHFLVPAQHVAVRGAQRHLVVVRFLLLEFLGVELEVVRLESFVFIQRKCVLDSSVLDILLLEDGLGLLGVGSLSHVQGLVVHRRLLDQVVENRHVDQVLDGHFEDVPHLGVGSLRVVLRLELSLQDLN